MLGCVIGPDGSLLNMKDIKWHKDVLIKQAASSMTTASSSCTIYPIFHSQPVIVVVGACHSGHTTCPSNRLTDTYNAKTLSSNTTHKWKLSGSTAASCCVNHNFIVACLILS